MIIPTIEKTPWTNESRKSITGLARGPMCDNATPNSVENTRICKMSFLARASITLAGIMLSRKSTIPVGFAALAV
jgi:hypothetical protein